MKMIANITERMLKEDWKQTTDLVQVRLNFCTVTFVAFSFWRVNETSADERAP